MRRFIFRAGLAALTVAAIQAEKSPAQVNGAAQVQVAPPVQAKPGVVVGGCMIAPMSQNPALRVINSDVVVVGKVGSIEADAVEVPPYKDAEEKVAYKVAVVKISDTLNGAKGLTHIKVGFTEQPQGVPGMRGGVGPGFRGRPVPGGKIMPLPAPANPPADTPQTEEGKADGKMFQLQVQIQPAPVQGAPAAPPMKARPGVMMPFRQNVELKEGMKGCFFLEKHSSGEFYVMTMMAPMLSSEDKDYKDQLEIVKKACEVIHDPMKALKAEKATDRFSAALFLVTKYRSQRNVNGEEMKEVEIPAKENKLILESLLEGDWTKQDTFSGIFPTTIVYTLNLGQEGYKFPEIEQPAPAPGVPAPGGAVPAPGMRPMIMKVRPINMDKQNEKMKTAYQEWLKEDGAKYVIKKFVSADDKADDKKTDEKSGK